MNNEKLRFTAQDRQAVFQQLEKGKHSKTTRLWIPIMVSAAILCISMILWLPQRSGEEAVEMIQPPETGMSSDAGGPAVASFLEETTFITIVDDEGKGHVNIVTHYNKQQQTMYAYPLARNTYIAISSGVYRLYEAYQRDAHETVTAVSRLFDQSITAEKKLTMNELQQIMNNSPLTYVVEQELLLKGITQPSYTLQKGEHVLTADQLVGLILAATDYDYLDEMQLLPMLQSLLKEWHTLQPLNVVIQPTSEYMSPNIIGDVYYYQYDEQQLRALWK